MRWTDFIRRARKGGSPASSDLGQWIEAALLVVLLVQFGRVLWALVTPVGLYGDWRAREPVVVGADARRALFAGFDPFFRTGVMLAGQSGAQQVTSLPLKLYGIRLNEASGTGSAIIAGEGGVQASYAVGDEISPGVKLKAVQFDHVVIERGGAAETLFIDQSDGSTPTGPPSGPPTGQMPGGAPGGMAPGPSIGPAPAAPGAASAGPAPLTPERVLGNLNLQPRTERGRVTGIVVGGQGGEAFAQAGFRPGDIIVQVNGRPVTSPGDIQSLQGSIAPGARLSLMVERGAATVPIALILPDNR